MDKTELLVSEIKKAHANGNFSEAWEKWCNLHDIFNASDLSQQDNLKKRFDTMKLFSDVEVYDICKYGKDKYYIENKRDINSAVKVISEFLKSRRINFKIVGSLALDICGLPYRETPHDINIEAICTISQKEILKALSEQYGSSSHNYPGKPYVFEMAGWTVNIWSLDKFSHEKYVEKDGVKYGVVMDVLSEKMKYKRVKDYDDMMTLINKLILLNKTKE